MELNAFRDQQPDHPSSSPHPHQGNPEEGTELGDKRVKKRTKTGCKTCRLRRIKCDEGKPECDNCKKSKRQCGGYGAEAVRGDGSISQLKKSRRFAPYGDTSSFRPYKNIVPAPPRATTIATLPLDIRSTPRSPKRKREASTEQYAYPDRLGSFQSPRPSISIEETRQSISTSIPETPFRQALSRIPISSLLTIDQAAIAAFVSQQSLNTYTPNYYQSSPLTDPVLFDAFRHYVEVVAPTMSLIESSPPNPTILNHHVVPSLKACNLFTYQLPVMAVSGNWAIMEAILAISFLHISHVTRSSKQQAFLHYQLALKRLKMETAKANAARDLGLLAATLLLAWYELTTGDHLKWVRHMSGAMAVIIEFGSSRWRVTPEAAAVQGDVTLDCSMYAGMDGSGYNTTQQPLENMRAVTDRLQISTGRNLLHELFYLYAKMDVIQSLVRGAAPLLELSEWRYPLRGPTSTILGLHDALINLMARLSTFIATDRERKQSQEHDTKMPPPSNPRPSQASPNPSQPSTTPSTSSSPQTSSPWSWSLANSDTASQTPTTPQTPDHPPPPSPLQDWESLQHDFQILKTAIQQLDQPRVEPNMPTPFGPALIYKDLRVAAATMLLLASQIHLLRAHPSTPSFAPAAIGMMAAQTGPLVAQLMRIQEGLWDSGNFRIMTTTEDGRGVGGQGRTVDHVVSALSNSAWPMLVGGVQVRDEMQRTYLKTRLCDIYEISGFATAMRVRKGLEVAWGQRKRGEPSGFDDIDSDDDTDMSLIAQEEKAQARELKQRGELVVVGDEARFILVKDGEGWLGPSLDASEQPDITHAFGILGNKAVTGVNGPG